MKGRIVELLLLAAAFAVITAVSIAQHARGPVSTYSSYDTGPRGYRALYGALARVGIPVERLETRVAFMPADTGVLVISSTQLEAAAGLPAHGFTAGEVARLKQFAKTHRVLLFTPAGSPLARALGKEALRFDPGRYANAALARNPHAADAVYRAVAGRGTVLFDERVHGFVRDRSFWAALPSPVHAAVWIAAAMLVLALIERNIRALAPVAAEPPAERDSSSYIRSLAAMLQRGRAGGAAIARFAEDARRLRRHGAASARTQAHFEDLSALAQRTHPADADVVRAARLYAAIRKEV